MDSELEQEYETYAYYWIGQFNCKHEEISQFLGLEPTEIKIKGEPSKYIPNRIVKENSWILHSPLPKNEVFQDAHLAELVKVLVPKKEKVLALNEKYETGINCVGYYTNAHPGFGMSKKLISCLASLNVDIDFDLHNY